MNHYEEAEIREQKWGTLVGLMVDAGVCVTYLIKSVTSPHDNLRDEFKSIKTCDLPTLKKVIIRFIKAVQPRIQKADQILKEILAKVESV